MPKGKFEQKEIAMTFKILSIVSLAALSSISLAENSAFNQAYLGFGATTFDDGEQSQDTSGISMGAEFEVSNGIFLFADFNSYNYSESGEDFFGDEFEIDYSLSLTFLGAGYHIPSDFGSVYAKAGLNLINISADLESEFGSISTSESYTGTVWSAGLRSNQLGGMPLIADTNIQYVTYGDLADEVETEDDTNLYVNGSLEYSFSPDISAGVYTRLNTDGEETTLGARFGYHF